MTSLLIRLAIGVVFTFSLLGLLPDGVIADAAPADPDKPIIIFAASSTASTLELITQSAPNTPKIKIVIGPSGTLARQIAAGAPADIFISANDDWVSYLEKESALTGSPHPLIANRLVFAAPNGHQIFEEVFRSQFHMLVSPNRIALAEPKTAPLGRYSVNYLKSRGLWDSLKTKAVYSQSARQTFRLIETAGLAGYVYKSDAVQSDEVSILLELGPTQGVSIIYQAAVTAQSENKEAARAVIQYLSSATAAITWQRQGFSLLNDKDNISGDH